MRLKKHFCLVLACITIFGCFSVPAAAADVGEQRTAITERRATGKFDFEIPGKTMMKASSSFPMDYGETITITASYVPALDKMSHQSRSARSPCLQTQAHRMP